MLQARDVGTATTVVAMHEVRGRAAEPGWNTIFGGASYWPAQSHRRSGQVCLRRDCRDGRACAAEQLQRFAVPSIRYNGQTVDKPM